MTGSRRPPRRPPPLPAGAPEPRPSSAGDGNGRASTRSFTDGATTAFLLGTGMMLVASLVVWLFLNVKHEELATDGPPGSV